MDDNFWLFRRCCRFYAGIKKLDMLPAGTDGRKVCESVGIYSPDGEYLPLLLPVVTEGRPEEWLNRVEEAMFATTKKHLYKVLEESKGRGRQCAARRHLQQHTYFSITALCMDGNMNIYSITALHENACTCDFVTCWRLLSHAVAAVFLLHAQLSLCNARHQEGEVGQGQPGPNDHHSRPDGVDSRV